MARPPKDGSSADKCRQRLTTGPHAVLLGGAVREVRARRLISQEELGYRSQMHRNYIGALERGEANPTFVTLTRVARGLELPLSLLVRVYERRLGERCEEDQRRDERTAEREHRPESPDEAEESDPCS